MMLAFPPAAIETMHQTSLSWNFMNATGRLIIRPTPPARQLTYVTLLFSVSKIYLESLQAPIRICIKLEQYQE